MTPRLLRSVQVIDSTIRVETPNGPSFHRYNHDGYGETYFGGPWLGEGIGRIWPIFTGERGEYEIARGHDASVYLDAMLHFANAGGMIPEQVWDRAEPHANRISPSAKALAAPRRSPGAWRSSSDWWCAPKKNESSNSLRLSPTIS